MKIIEALSILKNNCSTQLDNIRLKIKLSPSEFNALLSIDKNEKLTCQNLSAKMGLSSSRGSRVISKLIHRGYLKEEKHKKDKRCNIISLSSKGLKVKDEIEELLSECEKKIRTKLTNQELQSIKGNLEKLIKIL